MIKDNLLLFVLILLILNVAIGNRPFLLNILLTNPLIGLAIIIGLIIGITIHEAAHAFVAYRLGDPTAKLEGRLTLNPGAHLDPIGSLALLFVGFGWGKPTPFDPFNLKNIKRDSALISAAGAISNFALAFFLSVPYLAMYYFGSLTPGLNRIYTYITPIIFFNLILGVFNLIPISPLDGFKVLAGLLPKNWYYDFIQTERYGVFILLLLLITGIIGKILFPIVSTLFNLLIPGFAAPF